MTDEVEKKTVEPSDHRNDEIEDALVLEETTVDDPTDDDSAVEGDNSSSEVLVDKHNRKSGIIPFILSGILCAAVGFGAAVLTQPSNPIWPVHPEVSALKDTTTDQFNLIDVRISQLESMLSAVEQRAVGDVFKSDLTVIETRQSDQFSKFQEAIENFSNRLGALEKSTIESAIPDELVAQYQDEVKRLKDTLESQRESLQQFMSETAETANEVTQRAKETVARGILSQIRAAIEAGTSFEEAVKQFEDEVGKTLPADLRAIAKEGVQTYQELRDSFADAARSALNAARDELDRNQGFNGIGSYLRKQFQARSVLPKTGDDADAVLSRAEQALRENDLSGALSELDTLPDAALARMQMWIDLAQQRNRAIQQLDNLSQEVEN